MADGLICFEQGRGPEYSVTGPYYGAYNGNYYMYIEGDYLQGGREAILRMQLSDIGNHIFRFEVISLFVEEIILFACIKIFRFLPGEDFEGISEFRRTSL